MKTAFDVAKPSVVSQILSQIATDGDPWSRGGCIVRRDAGRARVGKLRELQEGNFVIRCIRQGGVKDRLLWVGADG